MDLFSSSNEIFLAQNGITTESLGHPFVADVAKYPPLTREQFNQASKFWPVNFHEDKQYVCLVVYLEFVVCWGAG